MRWSVITSTGLMLAACSGDKEIETQDTSSAVDTEDTENGCTTDEDCGTGMICEDEICVDGDRNNDPDEAESMLWDSTEVGTINPSGDVDYYRFNAPAGETVRIYTEVSYTDSFGDEQPDLADTVLVLRDPNGQVVTWSDNYPTGTSVDTKDAVIQAYLSMGGEYLISVEDAGNYYGTTNQGDPGYSYALTLESWDLVTFEEDSAEDPGAFLELTRRNAWYSVGAMIDDDTDTDWIGLSWEDMGDGAESHLYIGGIVNLEGSDLSPSVIIWNEDGELISVKDNVGPNGGLLYPGGAINGDWTVEIYDSNGDGGEDYWTFLYFLLEGNNDYFWEMEDNSDISVAEPLELTEKQTSSGKYYSMAKKSGDLVGFEDEDWSMGENPYGDAYVLVCLNSEKDGSTILPTVELYDDAMNLLDSVQAESDPSENAVVLSGGMAQGNFYIRVSQETPEFIGELSDWYRYIVYVTTFEPSTYDCP